ncbi:hypothetical protein ACOMHN_038522 [Nucella lapillus]
MPGTQKCTTNYLGGCTHEKKKPFTAGDGNPLSVPEQSVTSWALLSGYQGPQFGKSAGNAEEEEEISSLGACCAS